MASAVRATGRFTNGPAAVPARPLFFAFPKPSASVPASVYGYTCGSLLHSQIGFVFPAWASFLRHSCPVPFRGCRR